MKWAYSIQNKVAASILLFVVLTVVVLNNIMDRRNDNEIHRAITSIYDDRLVVEGYIYQYAERFHEIAEYAYAHSQDDRGSVSGLTGALAEIHSLHTVYMRTKLTEKETAVYSDFRKVCKEMEEHLRAGNFKEAHGSARQGLIFLKELSSIQLAEGKVEIEKATKSYSSSSVLFTFEVAVIFIMLIIIQGLIFASKTLRSEAKNKSSLN